ncbi:Hypothetical_protein [Hexamita inflata]|uniref:Hypothetical_protein n=1 Tax=Hexamita inflata TaxID=28002 RepID=A0AA86RHU1_9EUKA|nr:Hypothetical protein HINF_LOCUS65810 [Hexamita inflata]
MIQLPLLKNFAKTQVSTRSTFKSNTDSFQEQYNNSSSFACVDKLITLRIHLKTSMNILLCQHKKMTKLSVIQQKLEQKIHSGFENQSILRQQIYQSNAHIK